MSEQEARCEGGCGIEGPHDADKFCDPAPEPQGLDAVSGNGTWDEADERYAAAMNAPSPDKVRGILRDEVVTVGGEPHIPLEVANRRLREVERERDEWKKRAEFERGVANGYAASASLAFRDKLEGKLREVERELQKCKRRRESWKARASKYRQRLDIAHTRCDAALSELARTKRQLTTLREAVERIASGEDDEGARC